MNQQTQTVDGLSLKFNHTTQLFELVSTTPCQSDVTLWNLNATHKKQSKKNPRKLTQTSTTNATK